MDCQCSIDCQIMGLDNGRLNITDDFGLHGRLPRI